MRKKEKRKLGNTLSIFTPKGKAKIHVGVLIMQRKLYRRNPVCAWPH